MKKPCIVGNWKMFKTTGEAVTLVSSLKAGIPKSVDCSVVVCPPFTALSAASKILTDTPIELGAQNMFHEDEGAYTGEISPLMIKDLNCRYVILGHSERRQYFKEDNLLINEKVKTALKYSIVPIVCIGESLAEREARQFLEVVKKQFEESFKGLTGEDMQRTVMAYEPVWAIGTGKTASPEQAEQMHSYIRRLLKEKFGNDVAAKVMILYGGSVKPDNIAALTEKPNVDGALVGGASLKAEQFIQIVVRSVTRDAAEVKSTK